MKTLAKTTLLVLLFSLSAALPALAITAPDSDPSISHIQGFRYLLEDGDVVIFGDYNLPYVTLPDEPADATYIFRLMDGETELGILTPRVYFDNGYNLGNFAFYFPASANISYGSSFTVRISQNPAYFPSPDSYDFVISPSAYTSATGQDENRTQLTIAIIAAAGRLESTYPDYTLLESGLTGTVLSSPTGENYYRKVLYGVQAMCPDLFLLQVLDFIYITEHAWTTNQSDEYRERFNAWAGASENATGEQLGMTPTASMALIFAFPICLGFIIVSAKKFGKVEPGFLAAALVLLVTFMMGWMPPAIFATIYQAMGIYLAFIWFYARG